MISTRSNADSYYKYVEGNVATIFAELLRGDISGASAGQFEVHEQTQTVRTVMTGKCGFRYGIEQRVDVEQEKLPNVSSSSMKATEPPPPRYRPLLTPHGTH